MSKKAEQVFEKIAISKALLNAAADKRIKQVYKTVFNSPKDAVKLRDKTQKQLGNIIDNRRGVSKKWMDGGPKDSAGIDALGVAIDTMDKKFVLEKELGKAFNRHKSNLKTQLNYNKGKMYSDKLKAHLKNKNKVIN